MAIDSTHVKCVWLFTGSAPPITAEAETLGVVAATPSVSVVDTTNLMDGDDAAISVGFVGVNGLVASRLGVNLTAVGTVDAMLTTPATGTGNTPPDSAPSGRGTV